MDASNRVQEIQELHEKIKGESEQANASYQVQANKHRMQVIFNLRNLVWAHSRKERFLSKRKSKLMPRFEGPFEVLERINSNAYKLNLPGDYGVSATFNVADLSPYLEDDTLENLRENSLQQGEDDGDQGPSQSKSKGVSNVLQKLGRNLGSRGAVFILA